MSPNNSGGTEKITINQCGDSIDSAANAGISPGNQWFVGGINNERVL